MTDDYDETAEHRALAHEARRTGRHTFHDAGRAYCAFCSLPIADEESDYACSGDCDDRRCAICDDRLWTDDEADRGTCLDCYADAHPQHLTARDREAGRRGWL